MRILLFFSRKFKRHRSCLLVLWLFMTPVMDHGTFERSNRSYGLLLLLGFDNQIFVIVALRVFDRSLFRRERHSHVRKRITSARPALRIRKFQSQLDDRLAFYCSFRARTERVSHGTLTISGLVQRSASSFFSNCILHNWVKLPRPC